MTQLSTNMSNYVEFLFEYKFLTCSQTLHIHIRSTISQHFVECKYVTGVLAASKNSLNRRPNYKNESKYVRESMPITFCFSFFIRYSFLFRKQKAYKQIYSEMVSWIRKASPKAEVTGAVSPEEGQCSLTDCFILGALVSDF